MDRWKALRLNRELLKALKQIPETDCVYPHISPLNRDKLCSEENYLESAEALIDRGRCQESYLPAVYQVQFA